ncbi:MAG TPA: ATP-binding protein [Polyangiaceae bacterium]|nr:ATP-binding protein [Polyangiaceae bacterium]
MIAVSIPELRLGRELGRGAHSVVYQGVRDGRLYAVKLPVVVEPGIDHDVAYRRFLREAVALARLRDPALPFVMEVGRVDGVPYLVMELAAGETLAQRLARGPLTEAEVVRLGRQLASALSVIHAAGLVHRDVKPLNIVFDESTGTARLVDLGSATPRDGSSNEAATRAYAAPEILGANARPADVRSDLYSLGLVLLEALGAGPGKDARRLGISPALFAVLGRLTEPDPEKRCPSARDLSGALESLAPAAAEAPKASRSVRTPSAEFHGRLVELERLRRAWGASQRRRGGILLLRGAAGAGKTRLARTFLAEVAEATGTVLSASCHPRDPRAFSAVRQLVEDHLHQCDRLSSAERARSYARLRALARDYGALLRLLSPALARVFHDAPTLPAAENAEQAFAEGLADFLQRLLSDLGPVVVFVDDVQWLDASSRRVLSRAANQAPTDKILFVFGARSGDAEADVARLTDIIKAPITHVELAPLGNEHIAAIAADYLGTDELGADVKDVLLRLSDGIPLRALEVLRTLVDEGILLPHWGRWALDARALAETDLPSGTVNLLRRRIDRLEPTTRAVLGVAAVLGMTFDESELEASTRAQGRSSLDALAEGIRAHVVEPHAPGSHRFIHHVVRDALLAAMDESTLREANQAVAQALDRHELAPTELRFEIERTPASGDRAPEALRALDADPVYRVASHYAAGVPSRTPRRAAEVNLLAGRAAVERFDNQRAIELLEFAEKSFAVAGLPFEPADRMLRAEARLRVGALQDALADFDRVVTETSDHLLRAAAHGRIAVVHDMQLDATRAWKALENAFGLLGESPPAESLSYAAGSARAWIKRQVSRGARAPSSAVDRRRDQILCALYYQAGRVAFSSGKPVRIALSALRALEPAERLGPSAELARAHLVYAFVLTLLGFREAGAKYLASGEDVGRRLRDPVVYSHALQLHHVIAVWGGHVQESIDAGARCVAEYGHWRELNDFNLVVYTLHQLECVRGRDSEGWRWLTLSIDRINRHDGRPLVPEYLLHGARAALTGLGRESEMQSLLHGVERASISVPRDSGSFYPLMFSPRLRTFTEKMDLGEGFEAIVSEFRALELAPEKVHLAVLEYYIHLAHARVHALLRAPASERKRGLPELERCAKDLRAASRGIALFVAHAVVIEAYLEWFSGRSEAARAKFDEAERLGSSETAPWVLYAVHRGRAHQLEAEGRKDAARDLAVLAEAVAVEHGSAYRARFVREEFGLRPRRGFDSGYGIPAASTSVSDDSSTLVPGTSRARRQLRALVRIGQARGQELSPDHQAAWVIEELLQALRAQRGFLFLAVDVSRVALEFPASRGTELELVAARDSAGRELGETASYHRPVVADALVAASEPDSDRPAARTRIGTTSRLSAMAAPLLVDDVTVGVVYLDRPLAEGAFVDADAEVLSALAGQVSIALELTRALRAREKAQESLRNAEKMDAVARLARGIAHDLNNMLSAIRMATMAMMTLPDAANLVGEDVKTIQAALQRANELTKQLGTFSRGEPRAPELVRLSERVERLLPVIRGLAGEFVQVECHVGDPASSVRIDPDRFDQVLMNLAVNARDAMDGKGTMRLSLDTVTLDDQHLQEHPRTASGRHVRLSLSDTGAGIPEDVRRKIFEPYFTTKQDRGGTGLGLASVYWIVAQAGGHIDVRSEVGEGTTFTIYLPAAESASTASSQGTTRTRTRRPATVLVVEPDPAAAQGLSRELAGLGHSVLSAMTPEEALDVARRSRNDIDLLVANVVLPGMNGLELSRKLEELVPRLGVLFVSSDTSGVLAARGILGEEVGILPLPVSGDELRRRIRAILAAVRGKRPRTPEAPAT